jgi:hypothetical protein
MESGNKAKQEELRPRDPEEHELHRLGSEASVSTRRSAVVTPLDPSAEVVQQLSTSGATVPREPNDADLRQLHALSGGTVRSESRAVRAEEAIRPREPVEVEVKALLQHP